MKIRSPSFSGYVPTIKTYQTLRSTLSGLLLLHCAHLKYSEPLILCTFPSLSVFLCSSPCLSVFFRIFLRLSGPSELLFLCISPSPSVHLSYIYAILPHTPATPPHPEPPTYPRLHPGTLLICILCFSSSVPVALIIRSPVQHFFVAGVNRNHECTENGKVSAQKTVTTVHKNQ